MTLAFWISAAAIGYIVAGWPFLLALLARWRGSSPRKEFTPRGVSVIIAVHNGESYLRAKLESVLALDYPPELMEILVISDGSTDATEAVAEAFPGVRLLRVARGGKCRALNAAIRQAQGEILFLTDVRQQLDANCLRNLVSNFADPRVGVVSGELRIRPRPGADAGSQDVSLYWRMELWIRDRLSRLDSMFGATGAVYAMRRELAVELPEEILLDDMYLPLAAFFRGFRLVLDRAAVAWDVASSVDAEFSRKVRTLAGNFQLLRYYPQLLVPVRNRMWLHYVSYKIGRLLLPWFLLALLVSSGFMPFPWSGVLLAAQGVAYGLAWVDPWIAERTPLKRASSPARTLVVMMLAAAVSVRVFFVDPRSLWIVTNAKKESER